MSTGDAETSRTEAASLRGRPVARPAREAGPARGPPDERAAPGEHRRGAHPPHGAPPARPVAAPGAPSRRHPPPDSGVPREHAIVATLAHRLGLAFDAAPCPAPMPPRAAEVAPDLTPLIRHLCAGDPVSLLPLDPGAARPRVLLAPGRAGAQALVRLVTGAPDMASRLVLTTTHGLDAAAAHLLESLPPAHLLAALELPDAVRDCLRAAAARGGDPDAALRAAGEIGALDLVAALAGLLALPWCATVRPLADGPLPEIGDIAAPRGVRIDTPDGTRVALAGDDIDPGALAALLRRRPALRGALVLTTRRALRDGLLAAHGAAIVSRDALALARVAPEQSARASLSPGQKRAGLGLAAAAAAGLALAPDALLTGGSVAAAGAFLAVGGMRLGAAVAGTGPAFAPPRRPLPDAELPDYCVLVPLHREADALPGLVAALGGLDYPADRLDIKLLIEADDADTLAAARRHAAAPPFDIVLIPDAGPRTKPKALGIGLALTRAELVTVFDAEDRPDRDQLRHAAEVFAAAGPELACVQGRLAIDHVEHGTWIARLFGLDYAMHFDGLLPFLARWGLFFPLGGTSNHFRRAALAGVLGWDAFNVTEDADLAVRLLRRGYRMTVIPSSTREEATETPKAWIRQRSRWFKGWIQTWLVHMRAPRQLARELGLRDFLAVQILFPAALGTVAAFPAALVLAGLYLTGARGFSGSTLPEILLFSLHATSFCAGLVAAALLALTSLAARPLPLRRFDALLIVPYWLMMTAALAWAVIDLVRRPHYWDKTDHARAVRPGMNPGGQDRRPPSPRAGHPLSGPPEPPRRSIPDGMAAMHPTFGDRL